METDWLWGLIGGGIIGLGGAVYLLGNGRIMGASGIVGGLVDGLADGSDRKIALERLMFLAGVVLLPLLLQRFSSTQASTHMTDNVILIVSAGLLVGIGTRIANGCTSGHGVCGISRLSLRGLIATVFYILAGGLTLAIFRHGLGLI
ncbi:YeeE/YedE family protein [Parasedimentitalea psychrophila]|uniref:YeeE/YedE thiosulfate transporter family protein n=1 Tax=Parasedimentitalea psychrophila TaxID=2997337 RepID=A0A9Y2P4F8_9RHOB|nr:YeeE/YedE thiosulfate transporter family protein [Parasedimentitalea psychrophila]WIY25274.1 YeeE/YedE thiosulfate transporter family protein [Parasedimentitalea psychrophila]